MTTYQGWRDAVTGTAYISADGRPLDLRLRPRKPFADRIRVGLWRRRLLLELPRLGFWTGLLLRIRL